MPSPMKFGTAIDVGRAARGVRSFLADAGGGLRDAVSRGRLAARGARRRLVRTAARVERASDRHTALVALTALGLGAAAGWAATRRP